MSDALAFIRDQVVLNDGRTVGEALGADKWIEDKMLAPIFRRNVRDGMPYHRLCYIELPRGHWKSGAAAGVALTEAVLSDSTDVIVAAADTDQARIILENIDGYCARNPTLAALFRTRGDERITTHGSRIRVISSDAPSAFGLGGTRQRFRIVCDELTAWRDDELWIALVSATGKVRDVQTLICSNAGYDSGKNWQWDIREAAQRERWGYLFSADGVIASWITPAWVEEMRALLPGAAFDRLIGNVWTAGAGDFVTADQWAACVDDWRTPVLAGSPAYTYIAGVDLGLTRDRTAIAVCHRDDDGIVLDQLQVFSGSKNEPVSIAQVERALLDCARRYDRLEVVVDPWQLKGSVERLRAARVRIVEHTFSASSVAKLSAALYQSISDATLRVYPDKELEREVLGLRTVQTPSGWRFDHRGGGYSDRAVAVALAVQPLLEKDHRRPRAPVIGFAEQAFSGAYATARPGQQLRPGMTL